jgi:iron-sulfur cluster repair protein YtfE (RIC family)
MNSAQLKENPSNRSTDAITLLTHDHHKAQDIFKKFDKVKDSISPQEKLQLVKEVCADLLIHMEIEEAIFYPAVRPEVKDDDMMNEAKVEHSGAKNLIRQLGELKPDDPMFDAKVTVLGEQIEHHVKEEEEEMFPKVKKTKIDLYALGEQLYAAKAKMRSDHGLSAE